jgi:hypothetical protein
MSEPVTVELLMQAAGVLLLDPRYRGLERNQLLKQAYRFVRECEERLPQLAAAESALEQQIEKRSELFPEGPRVPFPEAATKITGRSSRRAPDAFRKFLRRDRENQMLFDILEKHGVPEKDISMYRTQFEFWDRKSKTRPTEKK